METAQIQTQIKNPVIAKPGFFNKFLNRQHLILIIVLTALLAIRLYYFLITKNQPLWFDEAEYMNLARYWAFGQPFFGLNAARPLIFPILLAVLVKLGATESVVRLVPLFAAVFSSLMLYKVGKDMFDFKVGIFSAVMLGVFWSFLFYSFRILVDTLIALLFLFSVYLFWAGWEQNKRKLLWLLGPVLVVTVLTKFSAILLVFVIVAYILITNWKSLFQNKDAWIGAGLGLVVLIPFLLFEYFRFGSPLAFYLKAIPQRGGLELSLWQNFSAYMQGITLVNLVFLALFILGLLMLYKLFIGFDLLLRGEKSLRPDLFIFLWLVIGIIVFTWFGVSPQLGLEERWFFIIYPVIFLFSAKGLGAIFDFVKKYNRYVAVIAVIALVAFGGYQNLAQADALIKNRLTSYVEIQQAGAWIAANSGKNDIVFSLTTQPELQYASNREVYGLTSALQDFLSDVQNKSPKYVIVNPYFQLNNEQITTLDYIFSHPDEFMPAAGFGPFVDKDGKIPLITIFEVLNDSSGRQQILLQNNYQNSSLEAVQNSTNLSA